MGIKDKIENAKPTTWPADGLPKWKVKLIIRVAPLKAKMARLKTKILRKVRKNDG